MKPLKPFPMTIRTNTARAGALTYMIEQQLERLERHVSIVQPIGEAKKSMDELREQLKGLLADVIAARPSVAAIIALTPKRGK